MTEEPLRHPQTLGRRHPTDDQSYVVVNLNVFDDEGVVVDATDTTMTVDAVSDVVDHASQLSLLHRQGKDISQIVAELDEALVASGVLPEDVPEDEPAVSHSL